MMAQTRKSMILSSITLFTVVSHASPQAPAIAPFGPLFSSELLSELSKLYPPSTSTSVSSLTDATIPFPSLTDAILPFPTLLTTPASSVSQEPSSSISGTKTSSEPSRSIPPPSAAALPIISDVAVLGDSFAAGPGAGEPYDKNTKCRRYDGALGYLLYQQLQNFPPEGRDYREIRFIACSGAVLADMPKQVEQLDNTAADLIILSISGNDIGFEAIVKACIMGSVTRSCKSTIAVARAKINDDLRIEVEKVILSIFRRRRTARVFLLGYPHFFNVDTDQCDKAYFGLAPWLRVTKAKRTTLNGLNDQLNGMLFDAVKNIKDMNPLPWLTPGNLQWLDVTRGFEGHRFCEQGITEPDRTNPRTYFFHLTTSNIRNVPWLNSTWDNRTSSQSLSKCANTTGIADPNLGDLARCFEQSGMDIGSEWRAALQNNITDYSSIVFKTPLFKSRTFHPRLEGFEAERRVFVERWNGLYG